MSLEAEFAIAICCVTSGDNTEVLPRNAGSWMFPCKTGLSSPWLGGGEGRRGDV